jgi:hypothetical protein
MISWILLISWAVLAPIHNGTSSSKTSYAVHTQEFSSVQSCKCASIEVQKIAQGTKVVCVQK